MTTPPRIAAWLLEFSLPPAEREALAGDLWEEFRRHVVPTRGVTRARWWYRSQVARSLMPLIVRSFERAPLLRASMAMVSAALTAIVPTSMLVLLRSFVLQQVPLKTTAEPSIAFVVLLVSVGVLASLCGMASAVLLLNSEPRNR